MDDKGANCDWSNLDFAMQRASARGDYVSRVAKLDTKAATALLERKRLWLLGFSPTKWNDAVAFKMINGGPLMSHAGAAALLDLATNEISRVHASLSLQIPLKAFLYDNDHPAVLQESTLREAKKHFLDRSHKCTIKWHVRHQEFWSVHNMKERFGELNFDMTPVPIPEASLHYENPWFMALPPREKHMLWLIEKVWPVASLPDGMEDVFDLSQCISRYHPIRHGSVTTIPTITPGSKLWLRCRARVMIPEEKAAAMGIWNLPMDRLSASQISDTVGNAFEASQVLTVCAVRRAFLPLYKFAGQLQRPAAPAAAESVDQSRG